MTIFRVGFLSCLLILVFVRANADYGYQSEKVIFMQPQLNVSALRVLSGPIPSLVADFKILDVFALYDAHLKYKHANFGNMLFHDLEVASQLDPRFQDIYRLASSLLVFDAKMPKEAVFLLKRGGEMIPNSWEPPFFAGFIAASQLQDYDLAYELMRTAAQKENSTPSAVYLAASYLEHKSTKEDTILFLKSMLSIVPEVYQAGIQAKIKELQHIEQ